jgi:hypothetical protein
MIYSLGLVWLESVARFSSVYARPNLIHPDLLNRPFGNRVLNRVRPSFGLKTRCIHGGVETLGVPRVFYTRASEGYSVAEILSPNPLVYNTPKYTEIPCFQTRP